MQMTRYSIGKKHGGYVLEHVDGPHKIGLKKIPAKNGASLDEHALIKALITLRVPEVETARAMDELRSQQNVYITFDAKANEPLPL
jgi:hypothetical protein